MSGIYSPATCRELAQRFADCRLHRPARHARHDDGDVVAYELAPAEAPDGPSVRATLRIEKFVGGGFAGQVYRVRALAVQPAPADLLRPGGVYALKILVPPSGRARVLRNLLYMVGFQGPFQLQRNPAAVRSGALWQKLIRRGARLRFGDEGAVNDVRATLVDDRLGACGEISEWVDGRTWRLEVDDRLDLLRRWLRGRPVDAAFLGSPEFRAKKVFMARLVALLHDMGAHELARQYAWSTGKSQPNCLKRRGDDEPAAGLVAVDFRSGLTLLPILPMSPGDVPLILSGLRRGRPVQFDRGDLQRLRRFVAAHPEDFADLADLPARLAAQDAIYRDSVPDLAHHGSRLLTDRGLWRTISDSAVTGWRITGSLDADGERALRRRPGRALLLGACGVLPGVGRLLVRLNGHAAWRRHYRGLLTSGAYRRRVLDGTAAELAARWNREGRVTGARALRLADRRLRCLAERPLALLPAGVHRMLTNRSFAREKLAALFLRPLRLYRDAAQREAWLRAMVADGRREGLLGAGEAAEILGHVEDPYIQKYLKCLAVHLCTIPLTQMVSVSAALIYVLLHPELPRAQAWAVGLGIVAAFQVIPVSPGSLARGLFVLHLAVRERDLRNYGVALSLSFLKYVGYLAFPIQMAYRYPALARFMAVRWATGAVHAVPVFGERGALLEHWVFRMCYNGPLTLRRRLRGRDGLRAGVRSRRWHAALLAVAVGCAWSRLDPRAAAAVTGSAGWIATAGPTAAALLIGSATTLGAGGLPRSRRIAAAMAAAAAAAAVRAIMAALAGAPAEAGAALVVALWQMLLCGVLAGMAAAAVELALPEPVPGRGGAPA